MSKILSQAGTSLADTYDVEGSIVGVENLESTDVHLFDEMGGRVFSERLQSFIITLQTGGVSQSTAFDVNAGGIPDSPNRIVGAVLLSDVAARVTNCSLAILDPENGVELPFLAWDTSDDQDIAYRGDVGAGTANLILMRPTGGVNLPWLMSRIGVGKNMPSLQLRGVTAAFGAGTVVITGLVLLARANPGNPAPGAPSSHGLPIPSW